MRKGILQYVISDEVSALARLTFRESVDWGKKCPLSALIGVRIEQVKFVPRDKENSPK